MATLISTHNSNGCGGRCDSKCYDAEQPVCKCICGGVNHGVGLKRAIANTEVLIDELVENLTTDNYPVTHDVQTSLF